MKFLKNRDNLNNPEATLRNFLQVCNVKVSLSGIEKIRLHYAYPSLLSITDMLEDWDIDYMALQLKPEQLHEIPYPAIAHLRKNDGHFVVLTKLENDQIHLIDSEIGEDKMPIEKFAELWTGVVVLAEHAEHSGEKNYVQKQKADAFNRLSSTLATFLISICLIMPVFFFSIETAADYILKLMGIVACVLLVQKQMGKSSTLADSLCKPGVKANCNAIMNSSASKVFGMPLSEIGLLYFIGGVFTLAISLLFASPFPWGVVILNYAAIPFVLFSVFYQWRIVKSWCQLCLIVATILLVQATVMTFNFPKAPVTFHLTAITVFGYVLPAGVWFLIRQRFISSFTIDESKRKLDKFLRSEQVFSALLSGQKKVNESEFTYPLTLGNADAAIRITVVSNPGCGPCRVAHETMHNLVKSLSEEVRVDFVFLRNKNPDSEINQVIKCIIDLAVSRSAENALKVLHDWYSKPVSMSVKDWLKDHAVIISPEAERKVQMIMEEQQDWLDRAFIEDTPTILINGRRYPEEYTWNELIFHVRKISQRMAVEASVS